MRKFLNLKMVPPNLGGLGVFRHAYKVLGQNFEFRPSLKPENEKKNYKKLAKLAIFSSFEGGLKMIFLTKFFFLFFQLTVGNGKKMAPFSVFDLILRK